ncbi:hypothetical protein FDK21_13895 [Cohaesibacter sp. CAU 1516]|uniref:hypothetical protein n=1 Tax=Cohaesibacter sp. CAU 1516 TaxID=2576038 RepID=UPI0010FE26AA|nr:hypothetical protein [Cohaesibacter sp. CAU 1516]TLP44858.1 hypothetical protein FDK21_13895 [Cohaesibacter sp. CAU 1516]
METKLGAEVKTFLSIDEIRCKSFSLLLKEQRKRKKPSQTTHFYPTISPMGCLRPFAPLKYGQPWATLPFRSGPVICGAEATNQNGFRPEGKANLNKKRT